MSFATTCFCTRWASRRVSIQRLDSIDAILADPPEAEPNEGASS